MWIVLGVLAGLIGLVLIGVMLCDSNRFVTVSYRIADTGIRKKLRLVLLADLHNKQYGEGNEKLLAAIDAAAPDMILCAGDLMTSVPDASMRPAEQFVHALSEKYPFYYGNGNHEYRIYHETDKYGAMGAEYRSVLEGCGVCLLENESIDLPALGIRITGLDLPQYNYKKFRNTGIKTKDLEELIGKPKKDCYNILIAHNPAFFDAYAEWGARLTLSGHVHGGVMRLPGMGGVLSTSLTLFPKYDGGMFEKGGNRMIISRGLGSHTIPVRLFNPAELVVIDLVPDER